MLCLVNFPRLTSRTCCALDLLILNSKIRSETLYVTYSTVPTWTEIKVLNKLVTH